MADEGGGPGAFKIADGFVEITARVDEDALRRAVTDPVDRVAPKVKEKSKKKLGASMLSGITEAFTGGLKPALTLGFSGLSGISSAMSSNPYVAAIGLALGGSIAAAALPAIGAGLAAGIGLGAGLGVIGLGAYLVKDNPKVQKAATKLGKTFSSVFGKAAAPFIKPVTAALGIFDKLIKKIGPDLSKMFATVAPYIVPLATGLAGFVTNLLPGFQQMLTAMAPLLATFTKFLPIIGDAFSTMFADIGGGSEGANLFLGDLLTWLVGIIIATGKVVGWLSKMYVKVREFFMNIPGWLSAAGDWFVKVWHNISDFFTGMWDGVKGGGSAVSSWFTNTVAAIGNWFSSVGRWFSELPGKIWGFLSSIPGRMQAFWAGLFNKILYLIGYGIGKALLFFANLPGQIWAFLSAIPGQMQTFWSGLWTTITTWVSKTVTDIGAWFSLLPGRIGGFFSMIWTNITSWASRIWSGLISWVQRTISDVVAWWQGLPGKIVTSISSLKDKILGVVKGAKDWLVSAGKDIIAGLIAGIQSAMAGALKAIMNAASKIKDGFKDALGINSPSVVMKKEVGRWIPPGIAEGVVENAGSLRKAMAGLIPDITGNARQGAAQVAREATPSGPSLGGVTINIKGVWDFTDPGAVRQLIAMLYDLLKRYEKGYA